MGSHLQSKKMTNFEADFCGFAACVAVLGNVLTVVAVATAASAVIVITFAVL